MSRRGLEQSENEANANKPLMNDQANDPRNESPPQRSTAFLLPAAKVIAILLGFWVLFWAPIPFVSSLWNFHAKWAEVLTIRQRIGSWIAWRKNLVGARRQEVSLMLGEPLKTTYFGEAQMIYSLGKERGFFSIDNEWLLIYIDKDDRVSNVRLSHD